MSAVSKPGPKPAPTPAAAPEANKTAAASSAPAPLDAQGSAKPESTEILSGPARIKSTPAVEGIPESFPVQALSKLEAKGIAGQTFLLDGGALRGLKLEVRRVRDGKEPGFEIAFQLTPSKLAPLLEAMKKQEAKPGPLTFRELKVGEDGVAEYGSARAQIKHSSHRAPPDSDAQDQAWVLSLEGQKGGRIEVVHERAALAVRGLVRIHLKGDDATCTKQLDGLTKELGLAPLFAPPTAKSKKVNALMHALWQADNAKAAEFSKGELDKLSVADVEAALEAAGYSKERIAGIRYEEVYSGHFAAVDPEQAKEMGKAGARYLYSTVTAPEHVHSILMHGQKSSLERYKDGLIIEGMSTNSDFGTGGAVGVFTRLVTQDSIYSEQGWTGRTYKLLQTPGQLGRTDFYGWNGDYFGKRFELDSKQNFGLGLVAAIGAGGTYKTTNELIFTAGNRPENILRVIATSEEARGKLLKFLKEKGYEPHNGLALEDFVVLSPKFLIFGEAPYDSSDLPAFLADAKQKASDGNLAPLTWFLIEGPLEGSARAELETEIILGDNAPLRTALFKAARLRGELALGAGLDAVIDALAAKGDAGKISLDQLVSSMPEALFRSQSEKAFELLDARRKTFSSHSSPFGLSDDTWVRIYRALGSASGGGAKKLFDLAIDVRAQSLAQQRHDGFLSFLASHPLVQPEDPAAFLTSEVAKLVAGEPSPRLHLYAAQKLEPEARAALESRLIEADHASTLALLRQGLDAKPELALDGPALETLFQGMAEGSAIKKYLLGQVPDVILKLGHQPLLDRLVAHHGTKLDFNQYDQERWLSVVDTLLAKSGGEITPYVRDVLERGALRLLQRSEFLERLPSLAGLYQVEDATAFISGALQEIKGRGALQLMSLLRGPPELSAHRVAVVKALLESSAHEAKHLLGRARDAGNPAQLPLSAEERRELVKVLGHEATKTAALAFFGLEGRQILLDATQDLLPVFDEVLKGDTNPLGKLDLQTNAIAEVVGLLQARTDAHGPAVADWLLRKGAKAALGANELPFIGLLTNSKATLASIGLDGASAAELIKSTINAVSYYYGSPSYADQPTYAELPAGAKWLLFQGEDHPDDAALAAVELALPAWNWTEPVLEAVMKRIPNLSEEWKARLTAARVKK